MANVPRGTIVPFERWRHDQRQNKEIVTSFGFSYLGRCVKARTGAITSIVDGPYV